MEHIANSAELVILHGHAGLQFRNDHTDVVIDRLQWLQLKLALGIYMQWRGGKERKRRGGAVEEKRKKREN